MDDAVGKDYPHGTDDYQKKGARLDGEPISGPHPWIETGTITEAAEGLEPLSQSHHGRHDEHRYSVDYRHRSYCSIAEGSGGNVQGYRGYAAKALAAQRRTAPVEYFFNRQPRRVKVAPADGDIFRSVGHGYEDDE